MDIKSLLVLAHIVGVALGVGGATISDIFFTRILKSGKITKPDYDNLKVLSRVIWAGIIILIISGLAFLWRMYDSSGSVGILNSEKFLAKLTLVAVITVNGLVFHFKVFPKLKSMIGDKDFSKHHLLLSVTGAISVTGWYSIIILSTLRGVNLPYFAWLGLYLLILTSGIFVTRYVINRLTTK